MADLKREDMTKEEWRDYEYGLLEPGSVTITKLIDPADATEESELLGIATGENYNPKWKPSKPKQSQEPWG